MRGSGVARLRVVIVLLALLAGCGTAEGAAGPAIPHYTDLSTLLGAVAVRQQADQTARISLRGEILGGSSSLRFSGAGVLRGSGDEVAVKFLQVVTQSGADPVETGFVVLPDALYLLQPEQRSSSTPWIRVDRASTDPDDRRQLALATTLVESADPTRTLSRYGAATSIVASADDVIEGDPAVRYTIAIDLAAAAAQQPDPAVRAQLQQQVDAGLTRLETTLWVDRADRPVRTTVNQDLPGIGTLSIVGSYRDWGGAVTIEAPPGSQVR